MIKPRGGAVCTIEVKVRERCYILKELFLHLGRQQLEEKEEERNSKPIRRP